MKMRKARKAKPAVKEVIPKFESEREEAEFWSAHDTTDYWRGAQEVPIEQLEIEPELRAQILENARKKQLVSLRLEKRQIELAKQIARRKTIPYQALIRTWIEEGIQKELGMSIVPVRRPLDFNVTGATIELGAGKSKSSFRDFSINSYTKESDKLLERLPVS